MKKWVGGLIAGAAAGTAISWIQRNRAADRSFRNLLRELTVGSNPGAILERVAERAAKLVHGTAAYVERVDPERDEIVAAAVHNGHSLPATGSRGPYHGSVAEQAITMGRPIVVKDVGKSRSLLAAINSHPAAVLPLVSEGKALGALIVIQGKRRFGNRTLSELQSFADTAAVSLRRATTLERLQRLLHTREEMLRILAHDLRNPVNTVSMAASTLRNSALTQQVQTNLLDIIERSVGRMNRLIQDLIDNAIIEHSGKLPLNPQNQAAHELAEEVCEITRIHAKTKTVHVQCETEGRGIVYVDRDRLLQVMGNLVDNAVKFTPEGGTVTVRSEVHDGEIRFSVSDTGPGISEDDRERIFEPYWQAPSTAHLGSGLGLAIAKQIVEQHGGRIWVETQEGHGSTFVLTLPAHTSN